MMATRLCARRAQNESSSLLVKRLGGGSPTALVSRWARRLGVIDIIHLLQKCVAHFRDF